MPDESIRGGKFLWIIMTGLVSLAVGVGGGLILHRWTVEKADLEYELKTSEVFTGQKENIAIFALEVRNPGKKEIEDLVCLIELSDSALREPKVTGLPYSSYSTSQAADSFQLEAPFLNPHERFSIQLLLALPNPKLSHPIIKVRGKGVTAKERTSEDLEKKKDPLSTALAAAISTMIIPLVLFLLIRLRPGLFYTKMHKDDQRDVLAYVLALNGFSELADSVRYSERRQYYWSVADALTEHCLVSGEEKVLRRGIKTLNDLVSYAGISESSQLLIHYDIARLAVRIPDKALVEEHIVLARRGDHKVIQKRIDLDPKLAEMTQAFEA